MDQPERQTDLQPQRRERDRQEIGEGGAPGTCNPRQGFQTLGCPTIPTYHDTLALFPGTMVPYTSPGAMVWHHTMAPGHCWIQSRIHPLPVFPAPLPNSCLFYPYFVAHLSFVQNSWCLKHIKLIPIIRSGIAQVKEKGGPFVTASNIQACLP